MASKVYISGANGRLGRAVYDLVGGIPLLRKKSGLENEKVTDFSQNGLKEILKDADVIIHIAGSVDTLDRKKLWESNLELTKKIVGAAPEKCRIIFASSISIYGKRIPKLPADENTPANPDSEYSRSKFEAERIVASRKNSVILRVGTLYGPQFGDYKKIFQRLVEGKMRIIGSGENRIPFVHVEDAAKAFASSIEKGSGVYVITGEPLTQKRIYDIASEELGVAPPKKSIQLRSAVLAAAFGEILHRLGGKRPSLTREHVAVLGYDRVFDCSRAKKELGFSPRPLEKGIREMVGKYKAAV